MSLPATLLLGFIAGATILLGLPVGRLQRATPQLKLFLNATAVGVLLFLVWDVLSAAWEPIDAALSAQHETGRRAGQRDRVRRAVRGRPERRTALAGVLRALDESGVWRGRPGPPRAGTVRGR